MDTDALTEKIKDLPLQAGVYLMKDVHDKIIYVGKAGQLRKRVQSYFNQHDTRYQVKFLISKVADIDCIVTDNDKEALLLEDVLIKKYKPKYNIFLRDDKTYLSLAINILHPFPRIFATRRIVKNGTLYFGPYSQAHSAYEVKEFIEKYFRLRTCSDHEFSNRSRPCLQYQIKRCDAPCVKYISEHDYAQLVEQVRLFLSGKNNDFRKQIENKMFIVSDNEQFEEAARLRDLLVAMDHLLEKQKMVSHRGESFDVIALARDMASVCVCVLQIKDGKLVDKYNFHFKSYDEDSELIKIFLLQYAEQKQSLASQVLIASGLEDQVAIEEILSQRLGYAVHLHHPHQGKKHDFILLAVANAQKALVLQQQHLQTFEQKLSKIKDYLGLTKIPLRMECYDISNIQGKDAIGSIACFVDGKPYKKGYRKFNIKHVDQSNDFAMIYETLYRRLKNHKEHPKDDKWSLPDLIIIDGGIGQLNVGLKVLEDLQLKLEMISLAKSRLKDERVHTDKPASLEELARTEERIFLPNRKNPIVINNRKPELCIIEQIRDEAHRFGVKGHRQLREKRGMQSQLDLLTGIGEKRRKHLLQVFGSVDVIKAATLEELQEKGKLPLKVASLIKNSLK